MSSRITFYSEYSHPHIEDIFTIEVALDLRELNSMNSQRLQVKIYFVLSLMSLFFEFH